TNGVPDYMEYSFDGGCLGAASEGALFHLSTVDFAGFTISGIALTVHAFSSAPSPTFPDFTDHHLSATLSVLGSPGGAAASPTPDPATLILFGTGLAGAALARRRHRPADR